MKTSQYAIDKIRKSYPLIDYLRSKGLTPVREFGNRWTFVCPIHKDNDPSFMVYKNDNDVRDYQTYFCWGCKVSGDVISAKAELEYGGQNGWGQSIKEFGKGIDLSVDGELDYIVNELKKQLLGEQFDINVFDNISMCVSSLGFAYSQEVGFEEKHLKFMESMYKMLDKYALSKDVASMEEAYEFLISDEYLRNFQDKYILEKEKKLIDAE